MSAIYLFQANTKNGWIINCQCFEYTFNLTSWAHSVRNCVVYSSHKTLLIWEWLCRSPSQFYLLTVRVEVFYFRLITLRHTPQSVGLLWTRDRPVAETSTWQHKYSQETNIHAPVGFEPTIPASARPQTYALDRAATGIGREWSYTTEFSCRVRHPAHNNV
jgi:hypothetical protein